MESVMNPVEIDKLKEILEKQLRELQLDLGKDFSSGTNAESVPDVNDLATIESERNFEIRIKDRERKLIGKVQEALKKIADGSYGTCESCGEAIGIKRLQARPVTTLCIACKSELEAEEKREENNNLFSQRSSSNNSSAM